MEEYFFHGRSDTVSVVIYHDKLTIINNYFN